MAHLDHLPRGVFAWGPGDRYFFSSQSQWAWSDLPQPEILQTGLNNKDIEFVHSIAFGPNDSYYISYAHDKGSKRSSQWRNIPERLERWMNKDTARAAAKVSLGPDGSFFAWHDTGVCWENLPSKLEESIQDWLSPTTGWKYGKPRSVALGYKGNFFALSERGAYSYELGHFPTLVQVTDGFKKNLGIELVEIFPRIQSVWLNQFKENEFVLVGQTDNQWWSTALDSTSAKSLDLYVVGRSIEKKEQSVIDDLRKQSTDLKMQGRKKAEADEEAARRAKEAEEAEQARAQARAERARAAKAEQEAAEHQRNVNKVYKPWVVACNKAVKDIETLQTFPAVPQAMVQCQDIACLASRIQIQGQGRQACKHDVEKLLRFDEAYSWEWLKVKRNIWHSDKWCRAPVEHREVFKKQADAMFVIIGQLMDDIQKT